MITTIALDLDNTLLNYYKQISKINENVLKSLHKSGKKIILCSGRPIQAISSMIKQLELTKPDDYVITFNGGVVQNNITKKVIAHNTFNKKDIIPIYQIAKKLNFTLDIVGLDKVYSLMELGKSKYENYMDKAMKFKNVNFNQIPDNQKYGKVTAAFKYIYRDKILKNLPSYLKNKFHIFRTRRSIEFVPHHVDKANGLKYLLDYCNGSFKNVIAFGDESNDIGMIKAAKIGVAMGNATLETKKAADAITETNNNNGVAIFLKNYFQF